MSDRYEILEKIGQGGIGAVYRAYDTHLKRDVALKRMLPDEQELKGDECTAIMLKEATTLSALQHPNIITVYDVGSDKDGAFVVMELLKGETLDEVIIRGVLTYKDFQEVVSQTLEALMAAEVAGVVHRDLKPTNLMVVWLPSKKFQIKILDFGLAKFSQTPSPQTVDHGDSILGSIYFMAPEQFERGNLDKRTDLYSMGCLYYYALAGQHPFQGDSAAQVMAGHLQSQVAALEEIRPDLPPTVCQWVMWLMSRYPENRPPGAREAYESFQYLVTEADHETTPIPAVIPQAPQNQVIHRTTTSRRLIIPANDHAITSTVTANPPTHTTYFSPTKPRSNRSFVIGSIVLVCLMITAAVLGMQLLNKEENRKLEFKRFEALIQNDHPRGDPDDVRFLTGYLDNFGTRASAAKRTLNLLESSTGESLSEAILEELKHSDSTIQLNLLDVVVDRPVPDAIPVLLKLAESAEADVRDKAITSLGVLGDVDVLPTLLAAASGNTRTAYSPPMDHAIQAICKRTEDRDSARQHLLKTYREREGDIRLTLLKYLGHVGGEETLDLVRTALASDQNEERLAALAALNAWPVRDPETAELILNHVVTPPNEVEGRSAVAAYLALAEKPGNEPLQENMYRNITDFLDVDPLKIRYLQGLAVKDADWALTLAQQMAQNSGESQNIHKKAEFTVDQITTRQKP